MAGPPPTLAIQMTHHRRELGRGGGEGTVSLMVREINPT